MKNTIVFVFIIITLLFTISAYAEDREYTVTDEIIEMVIEENLIQVRDRNYEVELVLIDIGMDTEPFVGSLSDLKVGSLVKVFVKGKGINFWKAEKVIAFTGKKREEMLKELDD